MSRDRLLLYAAALTRLKIACDVLLPRAFRHVMPPEEEGKPGDGIREAGRT